MLLYSTDCLKRNSKMKNKEQHTFPFIERLLDGVEVEWKPLGEVTKYEQPTTYLVKSANYDNAFTIPVLTAGKTFILGYTNETTGIYKASKSPVIIFDDFTTANKWVNFDFKVKSSAMKMVTSKDESKVLLRYIYHWLNTLPSEFTESDHKRQWISNFCYKKIPIPCPNNTKRSLAIQHRIVDILDKFTELEAELEAELEGRKRQYEYYRNQLLSIEVLNKGKQKTDKIPIRTMGEVGEFIRGKRFVKTDITTQGCPCIHYGEMYTHYGIWANKSKSFISPALVTQKNLRLAQTNDVIIVGAGETIEDLGVGTAWLSQTSVVIHDACFIFRSNLNPKYVAYFTRTNNFHDQLRRHVSSGKISAVNAKGLAKIQIPIPPLSEQQRIVSILDKFDTLTTSISEGLPKEIELRRKQYEYYRDRLLSFKH